VDLQLGVVQDDGVGDAEGVGRAEHLREVDLLLDVEHAALGRCFDGVRVFADVVEHLEVNGPEQALAREYERSHLVRLRALIRIG
jgi:hypothetical protein